MSLNSLMVGYAAVVVQYAARPRRFKKSIKGGRDQGRPALRESSQDAVQSIRTNKCESKKEP